MPPRFRATRTKLETSVEQNVVDYAKNTYGVRCYKLNVQGRRNLPDRLFLLPGGKPLFIEFKRQGKEPRAGQEYEMGLLKSLGYYVEVSDNVAEGRAIIDAAVKGARKCPKP